MITESVGSSPNYVITFDCVDDKNSYKIVESAVPLVNWIGKSVSVEYSLVEYEQQVQCIKAPCNPVKITGVKIFSITSLEPKSNKPYP
jgi:hypothetical protein